MNFSGGGFYDVAIAEGLTEVLMSTEVVQRHCILVAASNPCPFPTVYWPPNKREMQLVSHLSDAETVAKSFPQSCVSLSVICPKQLPMLKAIYNAGKRNPSATTTIDVIKNPNYLILISEDFLEARVALSPSVRTMNEYRPTRQPVLAGNIALAAVKVEPSVVSSVASNTPQAGRPKYVKIWEGKLDGKRHGQTVMITRLEAYRRSSSAEPLVEDWPSTLLIDRLVSQDHMHTKYDPHISAHVVHNFTYFLLYFLFFRHYTGKCEFFVFRAMHQHGFLGQMLEKKLVSHLEPKLSFSLGIYFQGDVCTAVPEYSKKNLGLGQQQKKKKRAQNCG
ncbi:putative mediator complex, subunit Med25, von Willebrand factor type A [Helianthus annuus]|nr:putative mediator complex, subunit Med25, von Willebrand factor type A [Helianthus annuus]